MALLDKLKKYYLAHMTCENCGKKCEIRIRKGTSVVDAVKGKEVVCDNCQCVIKSGEYTTTWIK
jgi:transcription elongation factor Elf1